MKKAVITAIVITGIVLAVALAWMRQFFWNLDHVLLGSVAGPEGRYIAWKYALGEGDTPPYGFAVAISDASAYPGPWSFSFQFVFKGYCQHDSILWRSSRQLELQCSGEVQSVYVRPSYKDVAFSVTRLQADAQPSVEPDSQR